MNPPASPPVPPPFSAPFTHRLPDAEIERFLAEDCPYGDLTTTILDIGSLPGRIVYTSRDETVVCCTEEAARLFERLGCSAKILRPTGALIQSGTPLLEAEGPAGSLHAGWKAGLNLLEAASGIATRTRALVRAAQQGAAGVEVVATRKVFPGTKPVAAKAVLAGGALPHRLGLSESVLVFHQHVVFLKDEAELWERIPRIKERAKEKKIAVEVNHQKDAVAAARAGVDVVQVDKLGPEELKELVHAVKAVSPGAIVAAAGGINLDNVAAYAAAGAEVLVTSAMYWGKPADIGVTMHRLPQVWV
jgi:molybdenum transport protein